jgi:glycosyltransferase involved in cell wall biosynthesis
MKKVLIITYYWPPAGGAGVQRWLKFVKYMRSFGWEPVIYTALNGEMPVIDKSLEKDLPANLEVIRKPIWEPYSIYKRFIGRKKEDKINASFLSENKKSGLAEKISVWIRGNFFIPDARVFWIRPSIKFLSRFVHEKNIEYVISTGPPHSMHMIALGVKKKIPVIKWLADFRDPWTNIDFYEKLMLTRFADARHHRMEKETLLFADRVISVGQFMNEEFKEIYKAAGGKESSKFRVITNGYDEADAARDLPVKDTKFSMAHVGTLVRDRNPDALWRVLKKIVNENAGFRDQLEIKLVGKVDIHVKEALARYGLADYLRIIPYLPHDEVIHEQERSRVLLLLVNNTRNAKGILTGKVFEYMAAGSPILAIGPVDGELADMLRQTGTGIICDFKDETALEKVILSYYRLETPKRNERAVKAFSRRELTRSLCSVLDELQGKL